MIGVLEPNARNFKLTNDDTQISGIHNTGWTFIGADGMIQLGPSINQDDIIGCGIEKQNSHTSIFFTKNGTWIGEAPYKVLSYLIR